MGPADYTKHIAEIADRHGLQLPHGATARVGPCSRGLTGAVYRAAPGWCVKLHEPLSADDRKMSAERAALRIVGDQLPVPRLLGFGITSAAPARAYQVLEWQQGEPWHEVAAGIDECGRLRVMHQAGTLLGTLHKLRPPEPREEPDIPHGNYLRWRGRNLPMLETNLTILRDAALLSEDHCVGIGRAVEAAGDRLFRSARALVHGDYSGENVLIEHSEGLPRVSAIIDWGNIGVDPLEADYEVLLMCFLLPQPDGDGDVAPYASSHFRDMCNAFESGYEARRCLPIDWYTMRAHALLQWVKRAARNLERNPARSRLLAASVRMAATWDPPHS